MKILDFIDKENLIEPGDSVAVALSGGPDSMALLHWLAAHKQMWQLELSAIHIHHGLRSASDEEERFVSQYCKVHGIPLEVVRVHLDSEVFAGMSLEEKARKARYGVFKDYSDRHRCKIALGHHMDDQAETVLMNLLRGAGAQGLKGMLPCRSVYIRPLLLTGRQEILSYCEEHEVSYVTDESNLTNDYTRNFLRNEIIPLLKEHIQPRLSHRLSTAARIFRDEEAVLSEITEKAFPGVARLEGKDWVIQREKFVDLEQAIKRRLLRQCLNRQGAEALRDITFDHIEESIGFIEEGQTGKILELPKGRIIRLDYELAYVTHAIEADQVSVLNELVDISDMSIDEPLIIQGFRFRIIAAQSETERAKTEYTKWFDYDKIGTDLTLRTRRPGDWLVYSQDGHRKKLKDFFIDAKISRTERDRIPLLTIGGEVIWIVGYRISEKYKINEMTQRILEVSLIEEVHQ